MSIPVDWKRSEINPYEIKSGLPVASREWAKLIGLSNHLHGKGAQLIPGCHIGATINNGNTETFHFYVAPKAEAVERVWSIMIRGKGAVSVYVTIDGQSHARSFATAPTQTQPIQIRQPLAARASSPEAVSITIKNQSPGDKIPITVESISMHEQSRGMLSPDVNDHGVQVQSGYPLAPIIDFGLAGNRSIGGVTRAFQNLDMRRAGHFHWSPGESNPLTVTATMEANLFDLEPPALTAVTKAGVTEEVLSAWVYAKTEGKGFVWFNGYPGSITSASYQWIEVEFEQACEDLNEPNHGLPGGSWPTISIKGSTSGGDTHIAAISIIRTKAPI